MSAPIFVLSEFRAGSTLLRYLLDTHPNVCCPAELRLAAFGQRALQVITLLTTDDVQSAGVDRQSSRLQWVRGVVDDVMDSYCQRKGKARWCDKSPANIDMAFILTGLFPDAQYVCLYRHGLDQVYSSLSMDGAARVESHLVRYGGNTIAAAIDRWCNQTEKLLAFEHANGNRCLRVLYEKFVEHPEDELARIMAFLGLPHVPGLSIAAFQTPHDPGPADAKIRGSTGVDKQRVGKGRSLDTRGVPPQLRKRFDRLVNVLGYEEAKGTD